MKNLALALAAFALMGSTAQAASLTNKTYTTARKAAVAGGAYAFNKAFKGGLYNTSNVRVTKAIDTVGPSQKYKVESTNGVRSKVVTVKQEASRTFRAYIPNARTYTPGGTYR